MKDNLVRPEIDFEKDLADNYSQDLVYLVKMCLRPITPPKEKGRKYVQNTRPSIDTLWSLME